MNNLWSHQISQYQSQRLMNDYPDWLDNHSASIEHSAFYIQTQYSDIPDMIGDEQHPPKPGNDWTMESQAILPVNMFTLWGYLWGINPLKSTKKLIHEFCILHS